jgi:hypothetical protein
LFALLVFALPVFALGRMTGTQPRLTLGSVSNPPLEPEPVPQPVPQPEPLPGQPEPPLPLQPPPTRPVPTDPPTHPSPPGR